MRMENSINTMICRGMVATHLGLFGGPGSPQGAGFGIESWPWEAAATPVGFGIEAIQATSASQDRGNQTRREAQAILAGPSLSLGEIETSFKFGQAEATVTKTSGNDFTIGQQSGLLLAKMTLNLPLAVSDGVTMALSVSRLALLNHGSTPSWQKQVFLARQGAGNSNGLALTGDTTVPPRDEGEPRRSPGDFLDRTTTVGLSLVYKMSWHIPRGR
jgi:hypothetical protein